MTDGEIFTWNGEHNPHVIHGYIFRTPQVIQVIVLLIVGNVLTSDYLDNLFSQIYSTVSIVQNFLLLLQDATIQN